MISEEDIDYEYKEIEKIKMLVKKKIEDKIRKGKISYSVKALKTKMILPVMGEKEMFFLSHNRKIHEATDSNNSKRIIINRSINIPNRRTAIFSPIRVNVKGSIINREGLTPPLLLHANHPIDMKHHNSKLQTSLDSMPRKMILNKSEKIRPKQNGLHYIRSNTNRTPDIYTKKDILDRNSPLLNIPKKKSISNIY